MAGFSRDSRPTRPAKKTEQAMREIFAHSLQQRLTAMGYEITVSAPAEASDRGGELSLDSEMFKDTATRVQFITGVLPGWKKDLCWAGFRTVRVTQGGVLEVGQDYSLGCGNT